MSDGAGSAALGIPGLVDPTALKTGPVATTYRARDEVSGRTVIVKVLASPLEGQAQARFDHEQTQMAGLSDHPNIVTVYGHGTTEDGLPYVVYEDVPGGTIRDRMAASGPLSGPDILQLGIRLAGALESAHRVGVLHGDIRPEDVLTSTYGDPLLTDFGLAALVAPPASAVTEPERLANVAPELLDGARPSPSTDVYALGSTLFTLLAGRPAFVRPDDSSVFGVVKRIASDPVPDVRPEGVPDPVASVVERAMAKDPSQRMGSAEEIGRALQQAQVTLGLPMTEMTVLGGGPGTAGAPTTVVAPVTAAFPAAGPPTGGPPPGPPVGPPPGPPGPPPPTKKSKAPLVIIGVLALLVIGGIAAALLLGGDDDEEAGPVRTTTTSEADETTTTTEEETTTTTEEETTTTTQGGGGGGALGNDPVAASQGIMGLPAGTPYSGTNTELTDESSALTMSVPEEWSDTNPASTSFGATISAAPQLQPFFDGFDVPGVIFAATADRGGEDLNAILAELGPSGCTDEGTGDYADPVYTGVFQVLSNCGGTSTGIVTVAARNGDGSETAMLLVQLVSDADLAALQTVLNTFNVTGTL
jgi:hypothetical protein